jgi:cytoskeletal protein RodZ
MLARIGAALALLLLAWSSRAAPQQPADARKKSVAPVKKKTAPQPDARRTPSSGVKTRSKTAATPDGKTSRKTKVASARSRPQSTPTAERYKQIQEALAAKGYLPPDQATGQWNDASVDALKRFQAAQNIDSNGRINSLSLIALGLGPKRDGSSAAIIPPAAPAPSPRSAAP